MTPRTEKENLVDILDRIAQINFAELLLIKAEEDEKEEDSKVGQVAFDAILYNLIVIGEIVKKLSIDIKDRNNTIPWNEIAGMRDILAHQYYNVNSEIVRTTIDKPLIALQECCEAELLKIK